MHSSLSIRPPTFVRQTVAVWKQRGIENSRQVPKCRTDVVSNGDAVLLGGVVFHARLGVAERKQIVAHDSTGKGSAILVAKLI